MSIKLHNYKCWSVGIMSVGITSVDYEFCLGQAFWILF